MKNSVPTYIFGILLLLSACSTEKNTLISRSYHNTTSNYNIFFNGNESFKRGVKKVEESYTDDFTRILPVFYYSDPAVAQIVSADMNRALEKSTKVIALHSITVKPDMKRGAQTDRQKAFYSKKEYNKWIDEIYVLMGKAYVFRNEYLVANQSLKKMIADFPEEESRYEAMIWLARSYNELKDYREAEKILIALTGDEDLPGKLEHEVYRTYADFFIKQMQYEKAIPWMEKTVEKVRKKHYKVRFNYILAQLYQETGNINKTVETYRKVIRMNPPYEMTFNAKINMASSFEAGSGKGKEIRGLLAKMLKDDKNIDFQDQIYYALGKIAMKQGNQEEALRNFKLSTEKSVSNPNQKGLSFIALGDIYYNIPEYRLSQAYYDSSMQNIDQDYQDYEVLAAKAKSLNHLVEHSSVAELEDSLQLLASLPEQERFAVIDRLIEEVLKKEEEERKRKQDEMLDMQYGMTMGNSNTQTGRANPEGAWYFYNMNAKGFGQPEFRMIWGNRRLEDNWRRKNKQSIEIIEQPEEGEIADSSAQQATKLLNNKNREFYLKEIPLTDSALELSKERLEAALYNMGLVYRNELKDTDEAIVSFLRVVDEFPAKENALLSAYNLYEIYELQSNTAKSNEYKNWIIRNFPESSRAKILENPDFLNRMLEEQNRANVFYEETYEKFSTSDYQGVIRNVEYALNEFKGHPNILKFRLLDAISRGKLGGNEVMSKSLEKLIEDFPESPESEYAKSLIEALYKESPELELADTEEKAVEIYSTDNSGMFFFGLAVTKVADVNQLKFNLINFNLDNFDRLKLSMEEEDINKIRFIFVKAFEDYELAQQYLALYESLPEDVFKDADPSNVFPFIISRTNYMVLKEDNDFKKYQVFFRKFYQP